MDQYRGADAFIELMNENGVEHIFFNPGADIAPIQVAVLRNRAEGKHTPELITCLHESVALTAAYGHYMVSGKPQVVMVHSELGTQQVGGALHNVQWGRIPVILWAGLASAPERLTWQGNPYDQGSMVRNCVKWEHEITPDEDIHDTLQEAFNTALAEPRGPVYLTYSREVLVNTVVKRSPDSYRKSVPTLPSADHSELEKIADALLEAKNPLIVAGYTARYPESVKNLIDLAEAFSCPVVPGLTRMNFPTTHPLCAGMEQMGGASRGNTAFTEADVILAIDYDTPYVPAGGSPKPDATILQIDSDPLTQGRPLWGRGADTFIKAESRDTIPTLTALIKERVIPELEPRIRERFTLLAKKHLELRRKLRREAEGQAQNKPISADWLCRCLAEVLEDNMVLVNHTISQSASVASQVERSEPGTLLACAGGSINWALGAALGAKTAEPDRMVVSLMTDGGFVWGCPVSALWTASAYKKPFLAIVFNNRSYGAIRRLVEGMSETSLTDEMGFAAGIDIPSPPDYAMIGRSCGGYGRTVKKPDEVLPALKEALEAVRHGKPCVLDVWLPRG